jgi:hypothetical protein
MSAPVHGYLNGRADCSCYICRSALAFWSARHALAEGEYLRYRLAYSDNASEAEASITQFNLFEGGPFYGPTYRT